MSKKKLPYYTIYPGDEEKDPAICSLTLEEYGAFCRLRNYMASGEPYGHLKVNHKVNLAANLGVILRVDIKVAQRLVENLLEMGVIQKSTDGTFYNEDMVLKNEVRLKRAAGGVLGGNKKLMKKEKKDNHKVNLTPNLKGESKDNHFPENEYVYENENENSNEGVQGEKPKNQNLKLPFASEEFAKVWAMWKEYQWEQYHFRYALVTEQLALEDLVRISGNDEKKAIEFIKVSAASKYKKIYNPKNFENGKSNTGPKASLTDTSGNIIKDGNTFWG